MPTMNPSNTRALPALAVTAVLAGCGETVPDEPITRSDSAGVEIVHSPAPAWTAETAARLSPEPRLRIGSLDGPDELQLHDVRFATILGDGRIAIGNSGTAEVRFFLPDGEFEMSVGGRGEGPGEFDFMTRSFSRLPGDTLRIFDGGTRRITEFTADGELVRSVALRAPGDEELGAFYAGTFPDGRIAVSTVELPPTSEMRDGDLVRGERLYWTLASGDLPAYEIVRVLEPERLVRIIQGNVGIVTLPFRLSSQPVVHRELVVASTDRHEVRWHSPEGELRRIARWDAEVVDLTQERFDEWIAGMPVEPDVAARIREQNEGVPLPPHLPTSEGALVDSGGAVWLEGFRLTPSEPALWTVVGPAGAWLGTVELPRGFEPYEIGEDYMIGVWHDDLDVPYVHVYDLVRPG
jgi:NOL1/NOP2/fmu family ribosome biogenesis protein